MNRHQPPHKGTPAKHSDESAGGSKPGSGRPKFDSRGSASWEWQTEEEGKFSADVDTQHLKKLSATDLSLEDTGETKALDFDKLRVGKPGFDPYDRGVLTNRGSAVGASEIKMKELKSKALPSKEGRKPIKDLRKYEEWLKMKQRLADQQDDQQEDD